MNYYELLGIPRKASREQIRAAYLRLAQEVHPDRQVGSVEEAQREAFKHIQQAYEVLHDPEKRQAYDLQHGAIPPPRDRSTSRAQPATYQGPVRTAASVRRDVPDGWGRRAHRPARAFTLFRLIAMAMVLAILASAIPHCTRFLEGELSESFATEETSEPKFQSAETDGFDVQTEIPDVAVVDFAPVGDELFPADTESVGLQTPARDPTPSVTNMADWALMQQDENVESQDLTSAFSSEIAASQDSAAIPNDAWRLPPAKSREPRDWNPQASQTDQLLSGTSRGYDSKAFNQSTSALAPFPPPPSFEPTTSMPRVSHAPPINTGTTRYDNLLQNNRQLPLTGGSTVPYARIGNAYGELPSTSTFGQSPWGGTRTDSFGYGGLNSGGLNSGGYSPAPAGTSQGYGGTGGLQNYEPSRDNDSGSGRSRTSSMFGY